jgi:hypothetical protein
MELGIESRLLNLRLKHVALPELIMSCPKIGLHKPFNKWTKRTIKKQPVILQKKKGGR